MSRLVVVFGATGAQGGAVMNAILPAGLFKVRAVTRNPDSPAAQALQQRGAEIVKADLCDTESLKNAVHGAEIVFGVTDAFEAVCPRSCICSNLELN